MSKVGLLSLALAVGALSLPGVGATPVRAGDSCARGDFEAVVDAAGTSLRQLNADNRPTFQAKLRQLKDKRGWSHDQFLAEAAPFVQDDKIAVFDRTSQTLLGEIAVMGQEGSEASSPDCALLAALRERMEKLVDAQKQKWAYMFAKIDQSLAK